MFKVRFTRKVSFSKHNLAVIFNAMEGYLYLVLSNQTRKPKFQIAEHFFNSDNTVYAGAYQILAVKAQAWFSYPS